MNHTRHIWYLSLVVFLSLTGSSALCGSLPENVTLTRDNWTEIVGFPVDKSLGVFKPGDMVTSKNMNKILNKIPPCIKLLMEKYKLTLLLREYKPFIPSDGYIAATNKYHRNVRIEDTGASYRKKGINNYVAGLPSPKPETGLDLAWDYQYGYNGDDAVVDFGVYWISASRGIERWEKWTWKYIMRAMHRTDIEPIPSIPGCEAKQIQYYSMTITHFPQDKQGFLSLYHRFEEPKDQEGWIYIPQMNKEARFSFGTRGDSWNNTDLFYEDVRGYMGYPEWMTWKILEKKTFLAPVNAEVPLGNENVEKAFDFVNWPHWNPRMKWQPRPVYVVEVMPKFPDYPYSKMIFYLDAESHYILYKEAYDKRGLLWKIILQAFNDSPDPRTMPPLFGCEFVVDVQNEHASVLAVYGMKPNVGLGEDEFNLTMLQKLGK